MSVASHLRLAGAPNFRDIGGHAVAAGQRIKRAQLFRSGELSHLTDADLDILRQLGVGLVVDLRSLNEVELHRSRWPEGLNTVRHEADITLDVRVEGRPIIELIIEAATPEDVTYAVSESFRALPELCGLALAQVIDHIVSRATPALFHCTNGRDRTGVLSALLLYVLGAPRETIVADFMTTNERIDVEMVLENSIATFRKAMGVDISREIMERVTLVHPSYIDTLFRGLDDKYGSPEAYMDAFGIDEAKRKKLRERLLEPA